MTRRARRALRGPSPTWRMWGRFSCTERIYVNHDCASRTLCHCIEIFRYGVSVCNSHVWCHLCGIHTDMRLRTRKSSKCPWDNYCPAYHHSPRHPCMLVHREWAQLALPSVKRQAPSMHTGTHAHHLQHARYSCSWHVHGIIPTSGSESRTPWFSLQVFFFAFSHYA
jgi:hypothetical protein